ncbi:MAG: carbonic anhydrase family protein [Pirellulales bacterium]
MTQAGSSFPWPYWPQQSPIDLNLDDSIYFDAPNDYFKEDYRDAPFAGDFEGEPGHANFVLSKPHSGKHPPHVMLAGQRAELVKIHLHTPAEHYLGGRPPRGEIHLIHKIRRPFGGSELIVLGAFFVDDRLPEESPLPSGHRIDPRKLLPKGNDKKWFRYEGSLTSSPYCENVTWLVFLDPVDTSSADFKKIRAFAHQSQRPLQPLCRRYVLRNFGPR